MLQVGTHQVIFYSDFIKRISPEKHDRFVNWIINAAQANMETFKSIRTNAVFAMYLLYTFPIVTRYYLAQHDFFRHVPKHCSPPTHTFDKQPCVTRSYYIRSTILTNSLLCRVYNEDLHRAECPLVYYPTQTLE